MEINRRDAIKQTALLGLTVSTVANASEKEKKKFL